MSWHDDKERYVMRIMDMRNEPAKCGAATMEILVSNSFANGSLLIAAIADRENNPYSSMNPGITWEYPLFAKLAIAAALVHEGATALPQKGTLLDPDTEARARQDLVTMASALINSATVLGGLMASLQVEYDAAKLGIQTVTYTIFSQEIINPRLEEYSHLLGVANARSNNDRGYTL